MPNSTDLGSCLEAMATELVTTGRINLAYWLGEFPSHAALLTEFAFELELADGAQHTSSVGEEPTADHDVIRSFTDRILTADVFAERQLGDRLMRARTAARPRSGDAKKPFKRAAVYAWAFDVIRGSARKCTAYSTGKAVYLLEHALDLSLFDSHRQMSYGPFDPKLKYGGARSIAAQQGWFSTTEDGAVLLAGPNVSGAEGYASRYVKEPEVAHSFLVYLSSFGFEDLELIASVLWACHRLSGDIAPVSWTTAAGIVEEWLATQWPEKLERPHFAEPRIAATLQRLQRLSLTPHTQSS